MAIQTYRAIQTKLTTAVTQAMSLNMLMWLTMLTLFAGLLCLAAAMYLALAAVLAPALAALFTGLALLGVCLLLVIGIRLALRAAAKPAAQPPQPRAGTPTDNAIEHGLRPVIGNRATDWTRDNTDMAIAGALAAGVIVAASPELRHAVARAAGSIVNRRIGRAIQALADR